VGLCPEEVIQVGLVDYWNNSFESPGMRGPLQLGFCELNSPTKNPWIMEQ